MNIKGLLAIAASACMVVLPQAAVAGKGFDYTYVDAGYRGIRADSIDADGVAFRYKDYRAGHRERWKTMTLTPHEFIRRFLSHILPKGFHRTRTGLHANDTLWNVDQAPHKLCARKLGAHDNSAATVLADQVKRGLADIDADGGDIGE